VPTLSSLSLCAVNCIAVSPQSQRHDLPNCWAWHIGVSYEWP
jgi:hypothetical protein